MNFSNGSAAIKAWRRQLCRESVFGDAATARVADRALKLVTADKPAPPDVDFPLMQAYRLALAELDLPPERRCRFARMSEAAAWTEGPLAPLHRILKARYRFVPYEEYLAGVHRTADALGRALERLPRGRVVLFCLGRSLRYGVRKSNLWVFFLMARRLQATRPAAFARLDDATTCVAGERPRGRVAAVLHVDDALYSGEQMINGMLDDDPCAPRAHATLIAVPFATTFALASLRRLARRTKSRSQEVKVLGRPEPIPSAFDGDDLTVAEFLRAVPENFTGVRPYSCTTVFEHKVADALSLPPAFAHPTPAHKVRFLRAKAPDMPYNPRKKPAATPGKLVALPRMPPLFKFGACRTGHYTDLLERVVNQLGVDLQSA